MDDLILTAVFDDDKIEILPPEPKTCSSGMMSSCDCCGRHAVMDEDCCGICDECLSA
jgi:hypothetical protein